MAQGPVAQGLCGSRALWLKDFVAQGPVAQRPLAQGPCGSRALWLKGLVAQRPVAQVQDRAVTKSDQHLKTDTIYKVLAFAVGSILSKGQNKK